MLNPGYDSARYQSEIWLQSVMSLSQQECKKVNYCDFAYFCAIVFPHANQEKLRILCDWSNWVFAFDDMFDDGELTNDPDTSQRIISNLLSIMLPDIHRSSDELVVLAHDSIYKRLAAGSSTSTMQRYVKATQHYCTGVLKHVKDHAADRTPTIQEMIETRRMSIGAFSMYPLVEFAYDLNIPDEVFLHPAIQALQNLVAELTMLHNDILSYRKEENINCPFNMVAVCRMNGLSAQEAFDEIASMVDERYIAWYENVKAVPSWGKEIDNDVQQYIQGIRNIVQANLSWSFRTGRYFGSEAKKVQESREIDVLTQPPFLSLRGSVVSV
ncbi:hypothetical protein N8I77_008338 [Diaporthe amygdali]|uniref:Terpene synthase n=1 Tax=Phomopsis amygdali TaxID=1214568 RepID=A0AAD9SEZ7_PHOAM|nr:hypothetical protein N8I77_008338 [Diaporthe amygdali]